MGQARVAVALVEAGERWLVPLVRSLIQRTFVRWAFVQWALVGWPFLFRAVLEGYFLGEPFVRAFAITFAQRRYSVEWIDICADVYEKVNA